MMNNTIKNMVLTGVVATVMVVGVGAPAVAEEVRDHHDDSGSNFGMIVDPVRDPGKDSDVGIIVDPVRDSGKDTNEGIVVTDPVNKDPGKDNQGIIVDPVREPAKGNEGINVDPVRDPGDNSDDASKTQGTISIHCAPGYELLKGEDPSGREDTCVSEDGKDTPSETTQPEKKLSKEIATVKEDALAEKAATASGVPPSPEDGQGYDTIVYGCPEGYDYDEEVDTCLPGSFGFFDLFFGGENQCCYSVGEGIAWWGHLPADLLKVTGAGFGSILLDYYIGETLSNWGEEIGGPLGWPLQGLGGAFSFAGQVFSGAVGGLGQVVGYASDGVGEAVDAIGDAAEDVWDEISSWF